VAALRLIDRPRSAFDDDEPKKPVDVVNAHDPLLAATITERKQSNEFDHNIVDD
jgi:hypothetical protein